MQPKYPTITVKVLDTDGNAFAILGACQAAAREANLPIEAISEFLGEAAKGDYEHLLRTVALWFNCE
jgi:hypothetical protein